MVSGMERVRLHRRATTGAPTTTEQAANMPSAWCSLKAMRPICPVVVFSSL